jgi:hypothetical protein
LIRDLQPANSPPHGLEDVLVSDGEAVYMRHLKYSLADVPAEDTSDITSGKGNRATGLRLPRAFSTAGLLDDSWFSRVGWSTGDKGGEFDLLVFDESATYALRTARQGGFGGWFQPGSGAYELVAYDRNPRKTRWRVKVQIRVRAMLAAGQTVFVAGPADEVSQPDPWAAFEGKHGARLLAISTADGVGQAEYRLDAAPVYDGMAAAGGRLYIPASDGRLRCLGAPP